MVEIEIEVTLFDRKREVVRVFDFVSQVIGTESVRLSRGVSSSYISLPCELVLYAERDLELSGPVEIFADRICLRSPTLILRHSTTKSPDQHILLAARAVESSLTKITTNGVDFSIAVVDREGIGYPAILHVVAKQPTVDDPALKEKYLRLKRILVHFRSHSRGSMARFRPKIENERVAGNPVGQGVLNQLVSDKILYLDDNFYFLRPEEIDEHLGVSWLDLRKGTISSKLLEYLRNIQ
ncbi:MAG TPA: hypothetical protein VG168_03610 [Bryobacteraceae bacterium]|jgi:hypothetical protein|nr:hypothetical protein [Bryobacteraceae bacterium]